MKYLLYIILSIMTLSLYGQDVHYTQYYHSPLLINPAFTAATNNDIQVIANARQQWGSVTIPYQTGSISGELALFPSKDDYKNSYLGFGLSFLYDDAGDGNFRQVHTNISVAWHQMMSEKTYISIGGQYGGVRHSLNSQNLFYDNQFDGQGFDRELPSGENITRENFFYSDVSAGISLRQAIGKWSDFYIGVGAYHLNTPNVSFYDDNQEDLDSRYTIQTGGNFRLRRTYLNTNILYMRQGVFSQWNSSVLMRKNLSRENMSYAVGLGWRKNVGENQVTDALIPTARLNWENLGVAISYDVNLSTLARASKTIGAIELAVIWQGNIFEKGWRNRENVSKVPCPNMNKKVPLGWY